MVSALSFTVGLDALLGASCFARYVTEPLNPAIVALRLPRPGLNQNLDHFKGKHSEQQLTKVTEIGVVCTVDFEHAFR